MKGNLLSTITRSAGLFGLKVRKASPEILVVAGVVGTVAATVMACKATLKATDVIEEHKEKMDSVHEASESFSDEYTPEDAKKDTVVVYTQTAVKLAKLYAPAVIIGTLSIISVFTGHNITRKRNVALAAAYATIDKGFKEYRDRVVARFGKELDYELKHNVKAQEIEEVVVDEKTGEEKVETKVVSVTDPNLNSDYARFFDDGCTGWTKDPELNLMFLRRQQDAANERLKAQGYLFLNDVYEMLAIPKTKAGQCVGWIYDEKNPIGDNFVDFGIYDYTKETVRNFVNGYEKTILLDFNVDGNILDMI